MQFFELVLTGNLKTQKKSKAGRSNHHLNWKTRLSARGHYQT